jgi:hypothetical protein
VYNADTQTSSGDEHLMFAMVAGSESDSYNQFQIEFLKRNLEIFDADL